MSSIIDALKKSDQNRNPGSQSNVNDINFSDNKPRKSRKGFWLLVMFLMLFAAGLYAWQQGWHQPLMNWIKQSAEAENSVDKANEQTTPAVQNNQVKTEKSVNNQQLMPPKQSEIREKTAQIASQKPTVKKPDPLEQQNPSEQQLVVTNNKSSTRSNSDNQKSADKTATTKTIEPLETTESPAVSTSGESQPTLKQDYLLIHQIDYAIRKEIPRIKINIHIYDPDPENRMVLINGERYNIGDIIENMLLVRDIVPEGMVVAYESLDFLIPK